MSRHRLVKNLDLDDELDDYDGGDDYAYDEGSQEPSMTEDDKAQMRASAIKVREALGSHLPGIADKEIEESLWYYYFDVDKSITWLRNKYTPKKSGSKTTPGKTTSTATSKHKSKAADAPEPTFYPPISTWTCASWSAEDFWRDSPWLKVPSHRRGELLLLPLCPRAGLPGGSSSRSGEAKVSKLAALAATRKRKDEEKKAVAGQENVRPQPNTSLALLGRLSGSKKSKSIDEHNKKPETDATSAQPAADTSNYEARESHSIAQKSQDQSSEAIGVGSNIPSSIGFEQYDLESLRAAPSIFAEAIVGRHTHGPRGALIECGCFTSAFASELSQADSNPFAEPSPDDVVIAAQSSKGQRSGKAGAKGADKSTDQVTSGVKAISADDSSRVKSKGLDVLAEYEKAKSKNVANFVVIGHVDHGKSTLMGRLLYDLKVIDGRTLEKYRKQAENVGKGSFALAWVLDQTSEERSRGVTMDIATNNFETDKTKFTILDAPGHRDFIPNMIAGASQADLAVLVIDGSPNAFESGLRGQTKEHALLVRSLGVQRIIVTVNKLDLLGWSEERFEEIRQQTMAFLTTAGFQSRNISFVPCSGLTGDNIARKPDDKKALWYKGPTLVEVLDHSEPSARALSKPLRITIGDIFRGGVQNPLSISGRLESGSLQVGDALIAMPSGEKAYVKGIEVEDEPRHWAVAGQIATLHLTEIDAVHLKAGDVLCPPTSPITNITSFTTKILAFDHVTPMNVDVHRARLHVPGRIAELIAMLGKANGEVLKKKPKILQPGSLARVRVELEQPVPFEAPTRIVLRANGETVGAGLLE